MLQTYIFMIQHFAMLPFIHFLTLPKKKNAGQSFALFLLLNGNIDLLVYLIQSQNFPVCTKQMKKKKKNQADLWQVQQKWPGKVDRAVH